MGELIHDDEFKTPTDKFVHELDALESYGNKNPVDNIARMSLFKQFDPLVSQSVAVNQPPPEQAINTITTAAEELHPNDNINQSATLIHINSPVSCKITTTSSPEITSNTNGVGGHDTNQAMSDEIRLLESKNAALEDLVIKLSLINEDIVNLSIVKVCALQESVEESRKEATKDCEIRKQLEDEINSVEKNYYEIHSRYDNLRSLVKEMDSRDEKNKARFNEMNSALMEKQNECLSWKARAEEAIER